jgi:hypothetical protein
MRPNGTKRRLNTSIRRDDSISPPGDQSLLSQLQILAVKAFHAFNLLGYGRVDFRVDEQGEPWILEVNAKPVPFARRRICRRPGAQRPELFGCPAADFERSNAPAAQIVEIRFASGL